MERLTLWGNKFTLELNGTSTTGSGQRTVGMNNDEYADYDYKSWSGTGKIIEVKTKNEVKFYFTTDSRKSHTAGVAFKRENYRKWDESLDEFIFSTKFSEEKSPATLSVSNKKAWIDELAQPIWDQRETHTTPAIEYQFSSLLIDTLIEKGIVAELETNQIQIPLSS